MGRLLIFAILSTVCCIPLVKCDTNSASLKILEESKATLPFTSSEDPSSNGYLRCGEVLTGNKSYIYYKPFESLVENERCFWIVGAPEAVGYKLNIIYLGDPKNDANSGRELAVTGVQYMSDGPAMFTYLPTSAESFTVNNASLLIITFYSSIPTGAPTSGFALSYEAIQENFESSARKTSPYSTHHLITPSTSTPAFRYPPPMPNYYGYRNYMDFELAAFILLPENNIYNGRRNGISYKTLGLEGCLDALYVYSLDTNGTTAETGIWKPDGRICENVTSLHISNEDVTLILFQSDSSGTRSGFELSLSNC